VRNASLLLAVAVLTACAPAGPTGHEFHGLAMGTTWMVKVVSDPLDEARSSAIENAVLEDLDAINSLMSHYLSRSELSRFNDRTATTPVPVSPEMLEVFRQALEIGELTGGALDVTVGPLVDAWGFGPPGRATEPPADEEIARLLEATGHEHLEIDAENGTLRKTEPGLQCNLSSIAKGYTVDRIARSLQEIGLTDFMVEVGGEIRVLGLNEERGFWRLAVERPQSEGRAVHRVVELTEGAMATSGDYRNWYEVEGRRVSHILDPRTGRPIEHRLASVTVVDDTCTRADALATALFVLGPENGFALAEESDLAALFLVRLEDGTFRESATTRFTELPGSGTDEDKGAPGR
jgi:thiamine biosynthesis lipoprotein